MRLLEVGAGARKSFVRHEMLGHVRDLGGRLEYVLSRYDRLVRDIAGMEVPSPDFESRVHLVNREIGDVTRRLQELFVLDYEARQAEAYDAFQQKTAARRQQRGTAPTPRRRERSSVVKPFAPAAYAPRAAEAADRPRVAVAQ